MEYLCHNNNEKNEFLIETTNFHDIDDDNHNISITLTDQSIENLKLLKKSGEISSSEAARRLKLLKSYLEYQKECEIDDRVAENSKSPFLLLDSCFGWWTLLLCRCYGIKNQISDIDEVES